MNLPRPLLALAATIAAAFASPAAAQDMPFDAYMQLVIAKARAEGISEGTIRRMTYDLTPNMRVIELDQSQPGSSSSPGYPPLQPYLDRHVDAARISGG